MYDYKYQRIEKEGKNKNNFRIFYDTTTASIRSPSSISKSSGVVLGLITWPSNKNFTLLAESDALDKKPLNNFSIGESYRIRSERERKRKRKKKKKMSATDRYKRKTIVRI